MITIRTVGAAIGAKVAGVLNATRILTVTWMIIVTWIPACVLDACKILIVKSQIIAIALIVITNGVIFKILAFVGEVAMQMRNVEMTMTATQLLDCLVKLL